jgi:hypothetical protein
MIGLLALAFALIPAQTPVQAQSACPPPAAFFPGQTGYVLPGLPNAVRDRPGTTAPSQVIGNLQGGEYFTVNGGPSCVDGYNWWLVESNTIRGWTADGNFSGPWVSPLACGNGLPSRLRAGTNARVTPGDPNNIRALPNSTTVYGQIPGGATFSVIGGPQCGVAGRTWWQVNYNGVTGWTAEGDPGVYWLEPAINVAPPTPTTGPVPAFCSLTPQLSIGATGIVAPGEPNVLRDRPGLNASGSTVIGSMAEGAIFTTLDGPRCVDGYHWWLVTAGGQTGWTAEGLNGVYWVNPLQCPGGQVSQLAPGMLAQISPGLPQRIRTSPDTDRGIVLTQVPAGGLVRVLNNFACDDEGRMWWLVVHRFYLGWTAEGENGVYWLNEVR